MSQPRKSHIHDTPIITLHARLFNNARSQFKKNLPFRQNATLHVRHRIQAGFTYFKSYRSGSLQFILPKFRIIFSATGRFIFFPLPESVKINVNAGKILLFSVDLSFLSACGKCKTNALSGSPFLCLISSLRPRKTLKQV